jgi:Zn-dependent protease with chaperone function
MIPGVFFDGRSSHAKRVDVWREGDSLKWRETDREYVVPLLSVEPSARVIGVPFVLRLPDGAHIQLEHDLMPADWFAGSHRLERVVDWLERRWPAALVGIFVVVATLGALFQFGLPWAADRLAMNMPHAIEVSMGRQSLAVLEGRALLPTTLPLDRRQHLRAIFQHFAGSLSGMPPVQLRFYASPLLGANAFALPDGSVVFTDALVRALPDDQAFIAVTAHELGHQAHHHMLRLVLRSSGVVIVGSMLMGDVASIGGMASGIPIFLLDSHYSRTFEEDADSFAFTALANQGIDPAAFVRAIQALERIRPDVGKGDQLRYLSSHPLTAERIARANAASHAFELTHAGR